MSSTKVSLSAAQQLAEAGKSLLEGDISSVRSSLRYLLLRETLSPAQYSIVSNLVNDLIECCKFSDTVRIAVLGSNTTQPIVSALRCALLADGMIAHVYEAPYGAYLQEILSPSSGLYAFQPDIVVIATGFSEVETHLHVPMTSEVEENALELVVEHWQVLWKVLAERLDKPVLQHLCEVPEEEYLGIAERRAGWSPSRFVESLNGRLIDTAPSLVRWIDVDRLAARVGRQNWHDMRLYYHGKFSFSPRFLPEYITVLTASLRGALGKIKKALILDLDNTLWGGVIGDDGMSGIRLGPETSEGEAYQSFCRYIKGLGQRGVILGICSKNELAIAAEVFEKHPHIPLKLDDFSVIHCNWNDKASNLSEIASELNIDISSIVFVDDNPAECELVRQVLPEIITIQLDGDPALFVRKIDHLHLFDSQGFSAEDIKRAESYKARANAVKLQSAAPDLDTYLGSLEMRGEVWLAREQDVPRLAQMEAKTNQFNLTTRRWTADQISRFLDAQDYDVLCFQLTDRFADHGLVGTMIVSYQGAEARIMSWLLSCRVFSRSCEAFMLNELVRYARERGAQKIIGEYTATEKNKVVAKLFTYLGFVAHHKRELYVLELSNPFQVNTFIHKMPSN
jgi:FkbH-like protein